MPVDHLIIPDTQVKPGVSTEHFEWIGKYIADKKPEVVIHLGDHFDMPSLSSYDKGTAKMEGLRLDNDIAAGRAAMLRMLLHIGKGGWWPERMVYLYGNHDERIIRYVNANPELIGAVGYKDYGLEGMGWECHDFLKPVDIDGIMYAHYFSNPLTGRPFTANALNLLKTLGRSYVQGHRQVLDFATRPLIDGSQQIGIVAGACYTHEEGYKGHQGNHHWRGVIVLHDVHNGFGNPMFVDLAYLKRKYGDKDMGKTSPGSNVNDGTSKRRARSKKGIDTTGQRVVPTGKETRIQSGPKGAVRSGPERLPAREKRR